jgi:sugar O-acyltransferase (sialic acid O-acetyltransferase NeuD family)
MVMSVTNAIGLLGNGSQADEADSFAPKRLTVAFRAVSTEYLSESSKDLIDISAPGTHEQTSVVAAVGAPGLKKLLIEAWPGQAYGSIVSDFSSVSSSTSVGRGSIIGAGAIVTTNVKLGCHVIVNIGATISHDCSIGDYVTVSPGAHIAGNVDVGDGVFVGIGATITNNISIAPGSIIGAGAVVLSDVLDENSVMVGVPAKCIRINQGWLHEL